MAASIAVVVKGYPRLSETFIAQELLALEQAGLRLLIVSLRHPTVVMAPWVDEPVELEVARTDAARLSRLGPIFGRAHRSHDGELKWSLAGTRTGLLVGFPGSGRYKDNPNYDPTTRPWFKMAIDAPDDAPRWGAPYTDASTRLRIIPCMARLRVGERPSFTGLRMDRMRGSAAA